MSHFRLNGIEKPLQVSSIAELIAAEGLTAEPAIAIAVNEMIVPKAQWHNTGLKAGDAVEIVKPFSGG